MHAPRKIQEVIEEAKLRNKSYWATHPEEYAEMLQIKDQRTLENKARHHSIPQSSQSEKQTKPKVPFRIPPHYKWYPQYQFFPWQIHQDKYYSQLTLIQRTVFSFICQRSTLSKKSPHRRYITISYIEISHHLSISLRTVKSIVPILFKHKLILRWFKGNSFSGSSRYEIPASYSQVLRWRIPKAKQKSKHG